MVDIRLFNVNKRFGKVTAAEDVCLDIDEGQFYTLLGPSGCGKTTILRMIAGFTKQDSGDIYFGDSIINDVPPHRRNTGLVFQTYALWPHMKVQDNIAFGLDFLGSISKKEKKKRVDQALKLVGLEGLGVRFPSQLSGGQQQRVALARALVIEPQVLLLDEPLSNLDAKLRVQMRGEIKGIQKRLGITTVYVTHDQEEALSISDEIAILNKGKIQQIGTPRSIYEDPENSFIAGFIGMTNFVGGVITEIDESGYMAIITTNDEVKIRAELENEDYWRKGMDTVVSVRPEAISIHRRGAAESYNIIDGVIESSSYLGNRVRYGVVTGWGDTWRADDHNPRHSYVFKEGEEISLAFDSHDVKLIKKD
jgi:ABC-type Fe3+/spermidine/putrescine transport system ATPase subunit